MFSPARRPFLLVSALAFLVAACTAGPAAMTTDPTRPPTPGASPTATPRPTKPVPTLVPTGSERPTGNTGHDYPELAVSAGGPGYIAELTDPAARAWRIVVTGADPGDRLELDVEVGDEVASVIVTTIMDGEVADINDLTGIVSTPTSAAGGCHPTLEICYSSGGIVVDLEAGRVGMILERIEPGTFEIVGATAGWDGEPFILGPWRTTDPFVTEG